jgi:glycopeptide antibiotics resistance protein
MYLLNRENFSIRFVIATYLLYYFVVIVLGNVTGWTSISTIRTLIQEDGTAFQPWINLHPFVPGTTWDFTMNVICFIPLGILVPQLSPLFSRFRFTVLFGFLFSFLIESGQLFTRSRESDINDLIANTLATAIGFAIYYLLFDLLLKRKLRHPSNLLGNLFPVLIVLIGVVLVFFR